MAVDEDSFVTIGTAFDVPEEDAPKKKALPLHEQFVTDKEGRRRFHGAFTGGFSAGYFNTVGSKEGWSPSTFVSSRSKRFESSQQKPEDFMDEDDLGDFGIAPRNVETTKLFSRERDDRDEPVKPVHSPGSAFTRLESVARYALEDLIVPCRMSIGVKLLKKMGWKEGQGIGPQVRQVSNSKKKVYGCVLPSGPLENNDETGQADIYAEGLLFAPKDTKPVTFVPKDNKHGIGYKGMIAPSAPSIIPKPGYSGNLKIKGQAFGVGAFEEADEDVYTQDSMSNYDIEIRDRKPPESHFHGWTGPPTHSEKGGVLSNFAQASKPRAANKVFPPPVIARGYQPFFAENRGCEVESGKAETEKRTAGHLTSDERGKLLGEEPLPIPVKSVFDYMNKSDKDRVMSAKMTKQEKPVENQTSPATSSSLSLQKKNFVGSTGFQPFVKDPTKQARYDYFLECTKSGKEVNMPKELCGGLTEWEREREKDEFARSAMIFQPLRGIIAARFTAGGSIDDERNDSCQERLDHRPETVQGKAAEIKMFGKLTRNTFEWHPAKLLCKRFNIPEPYPSSKTVGLVQQAESEKFNLGRLFKSSTLEINEQETNTNKSTVLSEPQLLPEPASEIAAVDKHIRDHGVSSPTSETNASLGNFNEQRNKDRPSMDLFKAIFAISSDESEESLSEDEVEDINKKASPVVSDITNVNVVSRISLDESAVKDVPSPGDIVSSAPGTKEISKQYHITQDSIDDNELEYGPRPPPRTSAKADNVPILELKPRRTIPFSGGTSGNESDVTHKKAKKRKHKRKHKQRQKEKEKDSKRPERVKVSESEKVNKNKRKELPNDKEILSKLKAVQKKRMCAADFM